MATPCTSLRGPSLRVLRQRGRRLCEPSGSPRRALAEVPKPQPRRPSRTQGRWHRPNGSTTGGDRTVDPLRARGALQSARPLRRPARAQVAANEERASAKWRRACACILCEPVGPRAGSLPRHPRPPPGPAAPPLSASRPRRPSGAVPTDRVRLARSRESGLRCVPRTPFAYCRAMEADPSSSRQQHDPRRRWPMTTAAASAAVAPVLARVLRRLSREAPKERAA